MSVLATDNPIGPALWYFFMITLIIGGIIAILVLFIRSKQPEDWEHKPITDENYTTGSLTHLADSIRSMSVDNTLLKNHIEMMFFEKIRTTHGFSIGELIEMKNKDPNKLRALIKDEEISDWILSINHKEKKTSQGFFNKEKISKKERYLMDINKVLDRMERWER
jgi:hypothetical protein